MRKTTTITDLLLAFPLAALANRTGPPTLAAHTALSLDTGATSGATTGLDAGTVTTTSPNGPTATLSTIPGGAAGSYYAQLPTGFNGSGGANVGAFGATVTPPTPLLTWTRGRARDTFGGLAGDACR